MVKTTSKKHKSDELESDDDSDLDCCNSDEGSYDVGIIYEAQATTIGSLNSLYNFLRKPTIVNPPNTPSTNIVDVGNGKCYNIPQHMIPAFFGYLDICRKEKVKGMMFNEKQGEFSGIMLDFDICQDTEDNQLTETFFNILVQKIADLLIKILDIQEKNIKIIMVITRKPKILFSESRNSFKDGFHILIQVLLFFSAHILF